MTDDWLARVDWSRRSPMLGELCLHRSHLGYVVVAIEIPELREGDAIADLWLALPRFPQLLHPLGFNAAGKLLVGYAALDWARRPEALAAPGAVRRIATIGVELTRLFAVVAVSVPAAERGWLACPMLFLDLLGEARVGFAAPDGSATLANRLPPEVVRGWPACDERGLVFAIGQLLLGAIELDATTRAHPLRAVVTRCLASDPAARFATLIELRAALVAAGGRRNARLAHVNSEAWAASEDGIGSLLIGRPNAALASFSAAARIAPTDGLAQAGYAEARRRGGRLLSHVPSVPAPQIRTLDWVVAGPLAEALRTDEDYTGALSILSATKLVDPLALYIATARTYEAAGELGPAIDHAQRALVLDPTDRAMHALRTNGLFATKRWPEALAAADAWLAAVPGDAAAHHVRGKCQFVAGHLVEARATFEQVNALDPAHLPAMWMRIEIERRMARTRLAVGVDRTAAPAYPAHLAEIGALVEQGRIHDALERLRAHADPDAVRMRAGCLAFLGEHAAALAAYEQLGDALGIARCLVQLQRADEALEALDADDRPEALEIATDALDQLGRTSDANDLISARARRARTSRRRTRSPPSPSREHRSRGPRCARCSGRTPCGSCRRRPSPGSSRP